VQNDGLRRTEKVEGEVEYRSPMPLAVNDLSKFIEQPFD
jgi:hypothetical protein